MSKDLEMDEPLIFKASMSKMGKRKMIMVPMALYDIIERDGFDKTLLEISCKKVKT